MSEETYEGNYIAIAPASGDFLVTAYYANHKVAWLANTYQPTRGEASEHAKFLMKEFSMGGEENPIAIIHLDDDRKVMLKNQVTLEWESTDQGVESQL